MATFTGGVGNDTLVGLDGGEITRISTDAQGTEANGSSFQTALSPDGTKVAFASSASNLVPGDANGTYDIFVKDLVTGAIQRVSTDQAGAQADGPSFSFVFSPDGSKLAFTSAADNLVPGDTNGAYDVFIKDLATGAIQRVSTDGLGLQVHGDSSGPSFSPDGTRLVFSSWAPDLTPGDANQTADVFIKDLLTGTVTRVSTDGQGNPADGFSSQASFTADGSHVVFQSDATNLVPGDNNFQSDVFVKDLATGAVTLASTSWTGVQGGDFSGTPSASPTQPEVLFGSVDNLTLDNAFGFYVKDLQTGGISLVSTGPDGVPMNITVGGDGSFSPDGTKVAFASQYDNFDTNGGLIQDVFVKDLATGALQRVSTDSQGGAADNYSEWVHTSADGNFAVFASVADNLVAGDTNGTEDIFLKVLNGNDTFTGGAGNDFIDGKAGDDTAVYSGDRTAYAISTDRAGLTTVQDLRPGSPDGTDTLVNVEHLRFADQTFDLRGANHAPVTSPDGASTAIGSAVSILATDLLANDVDPDGQSLSIASVGGAQHGIVTMSGGSVTFAPDPGFSGTAGFNYLASDGAGGTAAAHVSVEVGGASGNHPPVAVVDRIGTPYQTPLIISAASLLANDSDPDGDPLTITAVALTAGGTVSLAGGQITFDPAAGFYGTGGFTYTVSDGHGGLATGDVVVQVAPRPPLALTAGSPSNTIVEAGAAGPGQPSASATLTPSGGTGGYQFDLRGFTFDTSAHHFGGYYAAGQYGTFFFSPDMPGGIGYLLDNSLAATNQLKEGQVVTDTLGMAVTDGATTASAGVTFTIVGANDAPVAGPDAFQTTAGTPLAIAAASLLANDTDPEGDQISLTAVGGALHGTVSMANGQVVFTPASGFVGAAAFTYTVSDSHGASTTGLVSVDVTGEAHRLPAYIYHGGQSTPETIDLSIDGQKHAFVAGSGTTTVITGAAGSSVRLGSGDGVVQGGGGADVVTFGSGVGVVTGGVGPDSFIFEKGAIADPTAHGGRYDTVTDFTGAGVAYTPGRDFIWLKGFSNGTTLSYEHDLSGDPTAHIYRIDDGAYHAEIVLDYAGPGVALSHSQYGFL